MTQRNFSQYLNERPDKWPNKWPETFIYKLLELHICKGEI